MQSDRMQSDRPSPPVFPRIPLFTAAGVLLLSIGVAAAGRWSGPAGTAPAAERIAERELRFEDRADGAVIVIDAASGRQVQVLTGQNGFLRGTLRGFARTRKLDSVGHAPPFRLTSWSDGRLTLVDDTTGRHVDLEAFGRTNEAVFGNLLAPGLYAS